MTTLDRMERLEQSLKPAHVIKEDMKSYATLLRIEQLLKPAPVIKELSKPLEALPEETVRQPFSNPSKVDAKPEEPGWFKL